MSVSLSKSEHSLDAARSASKASRDSRRHALLVTVCTLPLMAYLGVELETDESMVRYQNADVEVGAYHVM